MTSKEALQEFYKIVVDNVIDKITNLYESIEAIQSWIKKYYTIENDLDRLEKCLKILKLIIGKNVNIVYLKIFNDYKQYSEYFTTYICKNVLSKEEFDLLKDVLENGL